MPPALAATLLTVSAPVTGTAESGVIVKVPAVEMLVALSSAVTFFAPVSVPVVAGHV